MLRHLRLAAAIAAALTLLVASSAAAAAGRGHGPITGVVPSRGGAHGHGGGGGSSTSSNLVYHGGPDLNKGNAVYAIFWSPSGWRSPIAGSYEYLIERFYTDVAAATAAGASSNVYYAATQYGELTPGSTFTSLGSLSNVEAFASPYPNPGSGGNVYIDTNPLPMSGCKDHDTSVCVTDAQVVSEINLDIKSAGWTAGQGKIFFMFTAEGVGSCYSRGSCSFTQWCAYHSSADSGGLIYANIPFADTVPSACDAGYHPNAAIDPNADATINVASHEHNESITDPFGSAWYNNSGYENGDLCAWNFGTVGSNQANQTINGDPYILQQEWSNHSSACVLTGW